MLKLGIGICGSFCNHLNCLKIYQELAKEYEITFFITDYVAKTDTRFGKSSDFIESLKIISPKIIDSIVEAEKYGPSIPLDIMLILPCSATTINKLHQGIYDNAVLLASKAHLRSGKPIVLGVASNDLLGLSAKNLFSLVNQKNFYFVPFGQDDYKNKPYSMQAHFNQTSKTIELALIGKQIQPIIKEHKES